MIKAIHLPYVIPLKVKLNSEKVNLDLCFMGEEENQQTDKSNKPILSSSKNNYPTIQ